MKYIRKIIAVLLSAFTIAFCLTGCVYENLDIRLGKNGTGSISTTVGLKKEFIKQITEAGGSDPFAGKETSEAEYDGEEYITFTETVEYSSFAEMGKALSELTFENEEMGDLTGVQPDDSDNDGEPDPDEESEDSGDDGLPSVVIKEDKPVFKSVKIEKDGSKYVFDAVMNAADNEIEGYVLSDVLKFSITVEMPSKIAAYKNGKVDGKKIVFDNLDLSKENELYAECSVSSPVPAVIGIVLAVGAVVAFVILKRRK